MNVIFKEPDEDQMIFNETSNIVKTTSTSSNMSKSTSSSSGFGQSAKSVKSEPVEVNKRTTSDLGKKESNVHQKENIKING